MTIYIVIFLFKRYGEHRNLHGLTHSVPTRRSSDLLPHGSVAEYRRDCTCRKPMPGMFTKAIEELHIDPARSILVGDKPTDIAAGHAAGLDRKSTRLNSSH